MKHGASTIQEARLLLHEWNRTETPLDPRRTLSDWLGESFASHAEKTALICGDARISYAELDRRSTLLASQLARAGARPEVLVAVCLPRTLELVVTLVAIVRSGAAYVPLDPKYPAERLAFMVSDSRSRLVVSTSVLRPEVEKWFSGESEKPDLLLVDSVNFDSSRGEEPIVDSAQSSNLAYVIYTSGSTGRPKAVGIEHRNVSALIEWARRAFSPEELRGVLFATSICFDLSIFELFVTLALGGTVILAQSVADWPNLAARNEITLINTVPAAMQELLAWKGIPESVRSVNLAGEPLKQSLVEALYQKPHVERVRDLYGPSECTVYSTAALRTPGGTASIGRPIANTRLYLLDPDFQLVPIGASGELFIGGAGVGRGYLNRPELNEARFLPSPFVRGDRLYRTGDLCRYRPNGELEYLGRIDQQVKIRGFRIELGEIENRLAEHPEVRECAVVTRLRQGIPELAACVVARPDFPTSQWRQFLKERLPDFMIPAQFFILPEFPRTSSGKIDRGELARMDFRREATSEWSGSGASIRAERT